MSDTMKPNMKTCITACWECRDECQTMLYTHCLQMGGKHVEAEHVKLMTDCIQICQASADFMTRSSSMHQAVCEACAQICEACAKSCEKIGGPEMQKCADTCRKCAASFREMSEHRKAA